MFAEIQLYREGSWQVIAQYSPFKEQVSNGYAGCGGYLEYDAAYVTAFLSSQEGHCFPRVSLPLPIDFLALRHERWPAFLLDLVPTGAGRRGWLERLQLDDNPTSDWSLLTRGARHPVGWLRVTDGQELPEPVIKPQGFPRSEVALRESGFLEYMISQGASVAGASDVQGESPKLLLVEDREGLLHADGALPDHQAARHWLVKFARNRSEREHQIIRNEGAYLRLASLLGVGVYAADQIAFDEERSLFIPRFDRACLSEGGVLRHGLESFASVAGTADFGVRTRHEEHCRLIATYSSCPAIDLLEYLRRDILNICLGNPDNHARNHAFLKQATGEVRISPLYDVAPMFLSDEGYARVVRWDQSRETMAQPDWLAVGNYLLTVPGTPGAQQIAVMYQLLADHFADFTEMARSAGVSDDVIARRRSTVDQNRALLADAAERIVR